MHSHTAQPRYIQSYSTAWVHTEQSEHFSVLLYYTKMACLPVELQDLLRYTHSRSTMFKQLCIWLCCRMSWCHCQQNLFCQQNQSCQQNQFCQQNQSCQQKLSLYMQFESQVPSDWDTMFGVSMLSSLQIILLSSALHQQGHVGVCA